MTTGTTGRGRPGGNPEFGVKYKAPRQGNERYDIPLTIKITNSMNEELDNIENKAEFCRQALKDALLKRNQEQQ
jgi:hypothetical protein